MQLGSQPSKAAGTAALTGREPHLSPGIGTTEHERSLPLAGEDLVSPTALVVDRPVPFEARDAASLAPSGRTRTDATLCAEGRRLAVLSELILPTCRRLSGDGPGAVKRLTDLPLAWPAGHAIIQIVQQYVEGGSPISDVIYIDATAGKAR